MPCNGQLLAITQNQALFAILGTTYGGNGVTTFALPKLQGAVPVHPGGVNNIPLGGIGGQAAHVLLPAEMPAHTHVFACKSTPGSVAKPNGAAPAGAKLTDGAPVDLPFDSTTDGKTMSPQSIATAGGNAAHNNMQPYLVVNYCIAMSGIFPSRN